VQSRFFANNGSRVDFVLRPELLNGIFAALIEVTGMNRSVRAVILFLSSFALAQHVDGVLIPVIVKDSHGQAITDVAPDSLLFKDRKMPVAKVRLSRSAELPTQLGVLIDVSNSERDSRWKPILAATQDFVNHTISRPEDRVFFSRFDIVAEAGSWLKKEQVSDISAGLRVGGGSAVYDAVAASCQLTFGTRDWRKPTRRLMVLISDGEDNMSHTRWQDAASDALRAGVVIFALSTNDPSRTSRGDRVLQALAENTGGEFFSGINGRNARQIFSRLTEQLTGMYFASYYPPDPQARIHDITIEPLPNAKWQLSYPHGYLWEMPHPSAP
jgi:Ca-activated chloride channel family protein